MLIKVRLRAGAKNDSVKKVAADTFEISVREKAEQNRANERAIVLLARELKLPAARVRIKRGHHRPSKLFEIT